MAKSTTDNNVPNTWIIRDKHFQREIRVYEKTPVFEKFYHKKKYNIKVSDFTYRMISYWGSEGLLLNKKDDKQGWKTYTILEMCWLHLIKRLREFGYPIKLLKELKNSLLLRFYNEKNDSFPIIEFHFLHAIKVKMPIYFLVFPNGDINIADLVTITDTKKMGNFDDHILISVNTILKKLFTDLDPILNYPKLRDLSEEENKLITWIRAYNYDSIKIKLKSGEIEYLEGEKYEDNTKRIAELLKNNKYQDIIIKQRDGNIVSIKSKKITKKK